jgi:hypothetical protein
VCVGTPPKRSETREEIEHTFAAFAKASASFALLRELCVGAACSL